MKTTMNKSTTKSAKLGRPAKPEKEKKLRVTVSLHPKADEDWKALARAAGVAKGHLAAWLAAAPEAKEAREMAVKYARYYVYGAPAR